MIRGCTEACNVRERTTLSQGEVKRREIDRKQGNVLIHRNDTLTWFDDVANIPGLDLYGTSIKAPSVR